MAQGRRGFLTTVAEPFRAVASVVAGVTAPLAWRWWNNPLLHHARRLKPMPLGLLRAVAPWLAGLLAGSAIFAWMLGGQFAGRAIGALLVGLSLGAVFVPVAAVGPVAAALAARQAQSVWRNPYALADIDPGEFTWGLALSALWRLRWAVVAGLVVTPALIVSVLRLDVVSFIAWRDSALVLNGATAASRAAWLLPDGGIPLFRLLLRALSAGMLPWAGLPLLAALGVTAGLLVPDSTLSPLAAMLGSALVGAAVMLAWRTLSLMPVLSGPGEVIRVALMAGLLALVGRAAGWLNTYNARRLLDGSVDSA